MAINERLQRFLDGEHVGYEVRPHREEFTAQEVAAATEVSGRKLAKVVVVHEDGQHPMMAVLPAPCFVDLAALARVVGAGKVALAPEVELARLFPDCEIGAMPPFGNLYGLTVYVDACFRGVEDFYFQGGNHHEVVRMRYGDYERLVKPVTAEFCFHLNG